LLRQLNTDESFLKDLLEIVDSYITKITNTHKRRRSQLTRTNVAVFLKSCEWKILKIAN